MEELNEFLRGISHDRQRMVAEAMADYFAVLWLLHLEKKGAEKTAKHRIQMWKEREDIGWPYGKAYTFLKKSECFFEIMSLLREKPAKAYWLLFG